jgi:hypothetical protein
MGITNVANTSAMTDETYYADMTAGDITITNTYTGIYVGVTGDVKYVASNGNDVIAANVPVGLTLVLKNITKIYETGTTALKLRVGRIE